MEHKFPEQFIKRYEAIIPDFNLFLKVLETPLKQSFRINTIKASKQ
jgi:16S rRNA C967 or C1407 C5-methylase (RsmB/RsmF family)